MPDSLEVIVQRMMNAGESDDAIEAVVKAYPSYKPAKVAKKDTYDGPTTFMGGFLQSLKPGGEADQAAWKGAKGFLKGATLDIPKTIKDSVYGVGAGLASILDSPQKHLAAAPQAFKEMGQGIADTFKYAGSDSEEFGRMVGQMTGQPIVAEGALAAIPRIPAAARATQRGTGRFIEGTGRLMREAEPAPGVPPTPRMLGTRLARRGVGKLGDALVRGGESMRMSGTGVQSPLDLAAQLPKKPASGNILHEPPPSQADVAGNPPIIEDPLDLAARAPEAPPESSFAGDYTAEADPMFQTPVVPPKGANLVKDKVPTIEDQFANVLEEGIAESSKAPSVEAPPPPYSHGAGAPPEQPRVSVRAPKSKVVKEAKPKAAAKIEEKFEPTIDPKNIAADEVARSLADIDPDTLRAALEKMAAKDASVNPATGEILEPPTPSTKPPRAGRKFRNPFSNETGAVGFDIGPIIESQLGERYPGDEAFDIGGLDAPVDLNDLFAPVKAPRPGVNPLRPEVPEGQVTNRQMFDLSAERGAENALAKESQDFGNQFLPHEFSEDMLFTPDELRTPDIPPMESPVSNHFDSRLAPGGVVSDSAPAPLSFEQIQKRIYELMDKDQAGTLTGPELAEAQKLNKEWRNHPDFNKRPSLLSDERGMVGKDISGKSVGDRRWSVAHPSGKPIADIEITRAEIAAARKAGKVPDGMSDVDYSNALFQEKLDTLGLDNGYGPNDLSRLRLTYHTKAAKEGSVDTNVRNPTAKSKPVGPKGKSWKVSGPKGESLGDITVTPDEIQEVMAIEGYADKSPDEISKIIYDDKLEDLMIDNGIDPDRMGELNIEQMNIREKRVGSPNKKEIPAEKATEPKPVEESTVSKLDPDKAFARGGSVEPIAAEADKLHKAGASDLKFKPLLPKNMQYALEEGDTFKGRLQVLLETIADESPAMEAFRAKRMKERDEFIKSVQGEIAPDEPVLRAKELRGLRSKDVKWSKKYGKFEPQ